MPWLLPGILELSDTARYLAFHAFLLDEFRQRALPATSAALSRFILRCEWDLGLAVQRCPLKCGSSPVGARRLNAAAGDHALLLRGESVESAFGGYGLYYRSPMAALGLVARAGSLLGERPTPIDLLRAESPRAARLAEAFRTAVGHTAYVHRWMGTDDPLPVEVVEEYAKHACLCRLRDRPDEQQVLHDALFTLDPGADDEPDSALARRRQGVAHFLSLVADDPDVAVRRAEAAFRSAAWRSENRRGPVHDRVADRWAALVAKDVWQDALCSLWSDFCSRGLRRCHELGRGLTAMEIQRLTEDMLTGPPALPTGSTTDLAAAVATGSVTLTLPDGGSLEPATADLEDLRMATLTADTAASGLVVLLELRRRADLRGGTDWTTALDTDSAWQPSVLRSLRGLDQRLAAGDSTVQTLRWLLDRFVIGTHERIAYSKLPDNTFRFRWEEGLLRFIDNGVHRFPLAAIRHEPLRKLTFDLGLWENPGAPVVTARGAAFVAEVLT